LTRWPSGGQANVYLGAAAVITRDNPALCNTTGALSASWVGIQGTGFAQIGWVKYNGFANRYFYWLGSGSVVFIANLPDTQTWKGDSYSISQGLGSPKQVYMFLTTNEGTSYNYTVNLDTAPVYIEWLGEVQHTQTQSPGESATKNHFSSVKKYYSGQWYSQIINDANLTSALGTQSHSASGSDDFYLWDNRY